MELGKVVGSVWATKKDERLNGQKLLIVQSVDEVGNEIKKTIVAADIVGAGIDDMVIIVRGGSARYAIQSKEAPVDAAIVGIVDSVVVDE